MTAKELIEALSKYPPDATVYLTAIDISCEYPIDEVQHVGFTNIDTSNDRPRLDDREDITFDERDDFRLVIQGTRV